MTAYFRPATLDEALAIRAAREVEIIAGGTDVYPNKTTRAGWGRMAHKDVLTSLPFQGCGASRRWTGTGGSAHS